MTANLDLIRAISVFIEHGELSIARSAEPNIEWVQADGPHPGTYIGISAMERGLKSAVNSCADYRVTVDEFRELDQEHVLVPIHRSGRGEASGFDLTQMKTEGATPYQTQPGKVVRMLDHFHRRRAFADLGVAE